MYMTFAFLLHCIIHVFFLSLCSRYVYCSKCFIEIPGDSVSVGDDANTIQTFSKSLFKEQRNNSVGQEP